MTRDPKIEAIWARQGKGYPYCHKRQIDCEHPESPGDGKFCAWCEYGGQGKHLLTSDLKERPFNHNAWKERLLKRIAYYGIYKIKGWDESAGKHFWIVNDAKIYDVIEARDIWIAWECAKNVICEKGGLKRLLN